MYTYIQYANSVSKTQSWKTWWARRSPGALPYADTPDDSRAYYSGASRREPDSNFISYMAQHGLTNLALPDLPFFYFRIFRKIFGCFWSF